MEPNNLYNEQYLKAIGKISAPKRVKWTSQEDKYKRYVDNQYYVVEYQNKGEYTRIKISDHYYDGHIPNIIIEKGSAKQQAYPGHKIKTTGQPSQALIMDIWDCDEEETVANIEYLVSALNIIKNKIRDGKI
ncbi:MAG: hypothetical protein KDH96_12445 [Candidatus Riesia sp.]|nr:hypothetical protein [Candidatus Riesia sp.]